VPRARVAPLAVDDHRRRQHQLADPGGVDPGQQHRGGVVVVQRVRRRVGRVDTVPDDCRLVTHRVDIAEQLGEQLDVGDVTTQEPVPGGVLGRGRAAVGRGQQVVQHHDFVARIGQQVGYVGTDEAGSSGYKHSHTGHARPAATR
jgi:hypothetical protein